MFFQINEIVLSVWEDYSLSGGRRDLNLPKAFMLLTRQWTNKCLSRVKFSN